jgi:predicted Co/Zn/Cd cation transporter (cation efflux family)
MIPIPIVHIKLYFHCSKASHVIAQSIKLWFLSSEIRSRQSRTVVGFSLEYLFSSTSHQHLAGFKSKEV